MINQPVLSGVLNTINAPVVVEQSQNLNLPDAGIVISLLMQVGWWSATHCTSTDMKNYLGCYGTALLDQNSDWECDLCVNEKTEECHVVSFAIS